MSTQENPHRHRRGDPERQGDEDRHRHHERQGDGGRHGNRHRHRHRQRDRDQDSPYTPRTQEPVRPDRQEPDQPEPRVDTHQPTKLSQDLNIFGIGISSNNNLDLLNLIVLACAGIMIKIFFQENYSKLGNIGPATTTIWGYGLTGVALSIMIFVGISYTNRKTDDDSLFGNKVSFYSSLGMITPIVVTLLVILYIIYLNIIFFTRINSNKVTPDYHTYSFMSSTLLLVQIILISNYLYKTLNNKDSKDDITIELTKMLTYILSVVNIVFIVMIHISLVFFSTDETTISRV
jgi:hypothetical protein